MNNAERTTNKQERSRPPLTPVRCRHLCTTISEYVDFEAIVMASNAIGKASPAEREWYIVGRWEEFEGEGRANLLRLIGVCAFYAVELINYHGLNLGFLQMAPVVDRAFHLAATMLTVAW